jgi:NtrC-family two-component system sensor histidine kinase KinB
MALLRSNPSSNAFRFILMVIGFAALIYRSVNTPYAEGWLGVGVLVVLFTVCLSLFPTRIFSRDHTLVFILALSSALIFPVSLVGWASILGLLIAWLLSGAVWGRRVSISTPNSWVELFSTVALIVLSLILALSFSPVREGENQFPQLYLSTIIWFVLFHTTLVLLDAFFQKAHDLPEFRRDLTWFFALELLTIPFAAATVIAYRSVGMVGWMLLSGILLVVAVLVNTIDRLWRDRQRFAGDLATLHQVSDVLQSTIDVDQLLPSLQQRVSQYLGVDNFYVAIYNQKEARISYPLAVKHGVRQSWASRPMADRLTDRVILERQPILIPSHARQELTRIGLPVGEDTPHAWMGVPLSSSDQVLGCLAVFSHTASVEFTPEDLELFITLSGQVSVAVANALLYEQIQRRALQLEAANQFTAGITQSLEIDTVYSQICQSAARLGDSSASAIFMLELERGNISLAHAKGLSEDFIRQHRSISFATDRRPQCLRTGAPEFISDVGVMEDVGHADLLRREGIKALANFPLISADGPLGYISLYYDDQGELIIEDVGLLQSLAAQAAMAISNARLHMRTDLALSRRVHQLSILQNISRELSRAVYSQELIDLILNYAMEFTNSNCGMVNLVDPMDQNLVVKAQRGYLAPLPAIPADHGLIAQALHQRKPVNIPDLTGVSDYIDFSNGSAKSHLSVPLVYQVLTLGVITLESALPEAFSDADVTFVSQMAGQAAIALQNARLYSEIAQVRDRLAAVLDSVAEGILLIQPDGQVVLANKSIEKYINQPIREITGKHLDELPFVTLSCLGYSPEEARSLVSQFKAGRISEDHRAIVTIRYPNSSTVLERTISTVVGEAGRDVGWMLILKDKSEEHRIDQARELITETLVHDLRSPMSAVLGSLEVIETTLPDGASTDNNVAAQALQVARRGAQRVLNLVETLMDISRLQSGKMEITRSLLDLDRLVKGVITEFLPQSHEYGLILRSELPPGLPRLFADSGKMTRVVANLVDNALKYSPSGSQIVISAYLEDESCVLVSISDQGPGIPEDYRQKIFERFSQVPGMRGRRRGTGLGLTFCKLAVEAHGGRIWVEPNSPQGSLFKFTIPLPAPGELFFD